jgi:hypothetical protein
MPLESVRFQISAVPLTIPVNVAAEKQDGVVVGSEDVIEPDTGAVTLPPLAPWLIAPLTIHCVPFAFAVMFAVKLPVNGFTEVAVQTPVSDWPQPLERIAYVPLIVDPVGSTVPVRSSVCP